MLWKCPQVSADVCRRQARFAREKWQLSKALCASPPGLAIPRSSISSCMNRQRQPAEGAALETHPVGSLDTSGIQQGVVWQGVPAAAAASPPPAPPAPAAQPAGCLTLHVRVCVWWVARVELITAARTKHPPGRAWALDPSRRRAAGAHPTHRPTSASQPVTQPVMERRLTAPDDEHLACLARAVVHPGSPVPTALRPGWTPARDV